MKPRLSQHIWWKKSFSKRISKWIGAPGFLEKAFVFDGLKIIDSQELQEGHARDVFGDLLSGYESPSVKDLDAPSIREWPNKKDPPI